MIQVLLAVFPAMVLVRQGQPGLAALYLFAAMGVLVARNLIRGQEVAGLAIVVGALPALMLLRDQILFHSVTLLLAAMVAAMLHRSTRNAQALRRSGWYVLLFIAAVYWLISFLLTGAYYSNLRIFEFAFGAAAIVLLAPHRAYLAGALYGLATSLVLSGLAMFSQGTRLGIASFGDITIGNPMTYGAPLALLFVLLAAERGRCLGLERHGILRLALTIVVSIFLLLSTARGSWFCAIVGLAVILYFDRFGRRTALATLFALAIAATAALYTDRGSTLRSAAERTFSSERSTLNRTSGRSDQWRLFPIVMAASPIWGYGPGTGGDIYARASFDHTLVQFRPGVRMQWHSLYLHVAIETGLIGILLMLFLLGGLTARNLRDIRSGGSVVPLLGTVGFMAAGMSVIAMDATAGLFLGFGLLHGSVIGERGQSSRLPESAPHGTALPMVARAKPLTAP